jgi:hypothetical protein
MVRWPAADRMSAISARVIEKFKKSGPVKDLEQDPREWVLVNWPWVPDPPYTFVVRATDGEQRRWVMGEDGLWVSHGTEPTTRPTAA